MSKKTIDATVRLYYTTPDLVARTGYSPAFWCTLRAKRQGPPFLVVSKRKTLYPIAEFEAWMQAHMTMTKAS